MKGLEERLRELTLFAGASEDAMRRIGGSSQSLRFDAGERILNEGDDAKEVFLLLTGKVGVFYSSEDGLDVLVKVFSAPSVFGEMELFTRLPRMEYVEVFEPAEVVTIEAAAFEAYLRSDNVACFTMLKDVAARLCISAYHERSLSFNPVESRVAELMLTFIDAYGKTAGGRITIDVRLTYDRLAKCLGVTEKSVERTLRKWLKQGWLERENGRYILIDREPLDALTDPARLLIHSRLGRDLR